MPYEFLPKVAMADIAFRASGRSLEEVFAAAADATMNVMVDNLESIQFRERRPFRLENVALDLLLFDLLQEFIYHKDAERLLLRAGELRITQVHGQWLLSGEGRGERLDQERHHQRADVKAVTLHQFKLEAIPGGWLAQVILDI
ncbi:MAG TPA: archease [Clostridia bacterium]|nr:archease [Clostridia bacterium]